MLKYLFQFYCLTESFLERLTLPDIYLGQILHERRIFYSISTKKTLPPSPLHFPFCLFIILSPTLTVSLSTHSLVLIPCWFPHKFTLSVLLAFLLTARSLSPVPHPHILPLPVSLQVVEIALKVSPILGAHMFQPVLPAIFRGIVDGEVSFTFYILAIWIGIMKKIFFFLW